MSHSDRNKHMVAARQQWAATRDGQITIKSRDVDHAYAVGFADGKKDGLMMAALAGGISPDTLREIKRLSELSLLAAAVDVSTDRDDSHPDRKDDFLADVNAALNTGYKRQHIDNWLSGRKATPSSVCGFCRRCVLQYLFGDDVAEDLRMLC